MLKLKIYNGAKPNTKQLRLRTNGYEQVDLAFLLEIFAELRKIRDTGYEVCGIDNPLKELIKEVLL